MSQPLLELSHLRVEIATSVGMIIPVDDVSMAIEPGEAVALVGESGCGKSTLLRAVLGLLEKPAGITGGRVLFEGQELSSMDEAGLRTVRGSRIAVVLQEPMSALNPLMRVGDQIAEAIHVCLAEDQASAQRQAIELMGRVGIPDPARRARCYPHEMSGGLRQRVMIALAMSCRPRLILLDEPTTALDVSVQDQILSLLRRLRAEEELSLLYVTHDLPVVANLCSRVVVMYGGRLLEDGPVADVFPQPRHPYTLGLLRSAPALDRTARRLAAIPGAPVTLSALPPGCLFHPRCCFAETVCESGQFPLHSVESSGRRTSCIRPWKCAESVASDPVFDCD